jgi:hypothetical protein
MMFAKPVSLNRHAHRELLFQPMGSCEFAAGLHAAPICTSEFFPAAKEYAIVFVRSANAQVLRIIVLGLKQDENCFVTADGHWHARYVPLGVRAYPFAAGEPGPDLQQKLMFLQEHQHEVSRTRQFGTELGRLGLLTERIAQLHISSNAHFQLKGFCVVDEAKLNAPDDVALLALARHGDLSLITAHLLSIGNLGLLAPRAACTAADQ